MKNFNQSLPDMDALQQIPILTLEDEDCGFQHQFSVRELIPFIPIPFMNSFSSARERESTGSMMLLSCFRRVPLYLCAHRTGMAMIF